MVVFTCQHCNATLKKPVVEKHYMTKCRRNPYLTCVDCLNDFHGDEYVSHTACVSEDQRYGGAGYVAKPVAVKQNNWVGIVQQCINNNPNPKYIAIFKRLANSPNLPRKKSKFVNFMSNAMNMKNTSLSEEIFDVFQQEFARTNKNSVNENKTENNSKATNGPEKIDVSQESSNNKTGKKKKNLSTSESNVQEESLTNGNTKKKSKKHRILDNANGIDPLEEVDQISNDNVKLECTKMEDGSEIKKKKKSKGSKEKENFDESLIEKETENSPSTNIETSAETQGTECTEKMSKKELKKLKKKQKYEAELKQIEVEKALESNSENITEEVPSESQMDVTKSKKKKRKMNVSESETQHKKKPKMEEPISEEIENHINEEEAEEPKRLGKFDWGEVIKEVLRSSSDQELSVKRLSKKVLAEYQSVKGERESFEELMSKFKKKLNKISGVRLLKDKAKLLPEI